MTITTTSPASLSDAALLEETLRAAGTERRATAELVALLAEVDARRLYLGQGYPSLFAWCTGVLRLSEPAAYSRITAARAARRYPLILTRLVGGEMTLTTITLLAAHLTVENHEALLDAARHKSKRDVERLIASLVPQPDIASSVHRLPAPIAPSDAPESAHAYVTDKDTAAPNATAQLEPHPATAAPRPVLAPLASDRYLLKVTLSAEARARLDRARDLLRHALPSGDPAAIVERALAVLVEQLERSRCAAAHRPRAKAEGPSAGRHVPAAVRRAVWQRDQGRCAFVGANGRCPETGWLELHHVAPFARGGPTTADNLELRCRAHNAYEAEQEFGVRVTRAPGRRVRAARALSSTSSVRTEFAGSLL